MTTDSGSKSLRRLTEHLRDVPVGPIDDSTELAAFLAESWDSLDVDPGSGMAAYKLHGRMEKVTWDPPFLRFTIERHGGTVLGSTRAELQGWRVDVTAGEASWTPAGHRQMRPRAPSLDVRPLADEIADLIIRRANDKRLKWREDGSVAVQIGQMIPDGGPLQTVAGRRKRFREALEAVLLEVGWTKSRANVYRPLPGKDVSSTP